MALSRIQTDALQSAITSSNILDGTIAAADLASNAVTGPKLASGSIETYMSTYGTPSMFRNMVKNGKFQVNQRSINTLTALTGYNTRIADIHRTGGGNQATARHTHSRVDALDTSASNYEAGGAPPGFQHAAKVLCTTADPVAVGYSQPLFYSTFIEGTDFTNRTGFGTSGALTLTLSFWVKSSLTGTYDVTLHNNGFSGTTRAIAVNYTINQANTWEKKTITIAGDTTANRWDPTTGVGIRLDWTIRADGTSATTVTPNVWQTNPVGGTVVGTAHPDVLGAVGRNWYITGIQLEVGSAATPFEHLPYEIELLSCQRYYQTYATHLSAGGNAPMSFVGFWYNSTQLFAPVKLTVPMRTGPSLGYSDLNHITLYQGTTTVSPTGISFANSYPQFVDMRMTVASGGTTGQATCVQINGTLGNGIYFSAEY